MTSQKPHCLTKTLSLTLPHPTGARVNVGALGEHMQSEAATKEITFSLCCIQGNS